MNDDELMHRLKAGDDVAREVSAKLLASIKELDLAVRYASGYQPDKGMFWWTVDKAEHALEKIHEYRKLLVDSGDRVR